MTEGENEFRTVSDFSQLPRGMRREVGEAIKKAWEETGIKEGETRLKEKLGFAGTIFDLRRKSINFRGITCGKELIAFVMYRRPANGKDCILNFIWAKRPKESPGGQAFSREFSVLPAEHLLESLVRDGVRYFLTASLTQSALRMKRGLIRRRLAQDVASRRGMTAFGVTNTGIERARARRHRLR